MAGELLGETPAVCTVPVTPVEARKLGDRGQSFMLQSRSSPFGNGDFFQLAEPRLAACRVRLITQLFISWTCFFLWIPAWNRACSLLHSCASRPGFRLGCWETLQHGDGWPRTRRRGSLRAVKPGPQQANATRSTLGKADSC